ncbi:MAG: hypothetical protein LQ342_003681 [Letrouitia transgressa]|nr:MAG: hypothetical protein LQ342_003681 [Letrouitia transgressa]
MSEAATKFTKDGSPVESLETLQTLLWTGFKTQLNQTTTVDSTERFAAIFRSLLPTIIDFAPPESSPRILEAMQKWTEAATSAASAFCNNRDAYHASPDASPHLGKVSRQMYKFVREDLNVPFLRSSQLRHKHDTSVNGITSKHQNGDLEGSREEQSGLTTGELATTIYEAIREGRLCEPVMNCLAEMENSV